MRRNIILKINYKTHGRNVCLDCPEAFQFSSKNRTCYCKIGEERTKCATECDFYNFAVKGIYTECGEKIHIETVEVKENG